MNRSWIDRAPTSGSAAGGTNITVRGTGFSQGGTTTVELGAVPATNVSVVSDTEVTCTVPAGTVGAVDVTLTNSRGTDTLAGAFTYTPIPVTVDVQGVLPLSGPTAGGTQKSGRMYRW